MNKNICDFTVVSITYNNPGIYKTIESVLPIIKAGGKMIIQNGGELLQLVNKGIEVYDEKDTGIYDAINKGISKVDTNFFMLLHAGDIFIGSIRNIESIIAELEIKSKDLSLNSQYIGSRFHDSKNWRPWMLNFGVQPPHLPVVYRSLVYKQLEYSKDIKIIADFIFFVTEVNWGKVNWNNKLLIQMETGGTTNSGLKSFLIVSVCFIKYFGLKGLFMAFARIPFKLLQAKR